MRNEDKRREALDLLDDAGSKLKLLQELLAAGDPEQFNLDEDSLAGASMLIGELGHAIDWAGDQFRP